MKSYGEHFEKSHPMWMDVLNQTGQTSFSNRPLLEGELGSWLWVLVLVVLASSLSAFLVTHHLMGRHRRREAMAASLKSPRRWMQSSPITLAALGQPRRWMAIRANHPEAIRRALGLVNPETCHWKEGLQRAAERHLFVSPPIRGWVLVFGRDVPVPFDDIDGFYARMRDIGLALGEVQYFCMDPVHQSHAWMRLVGDKVVRAYAWADQTLWQEGPFSAAEACLGMVCYDYAEDQPMFASHEIDPILDHNLSQIHGLAARWSLDPMSVRPSDLAAECGWSGEWHSVRA
ncbi:MAG: hypothetical protein ACPG4V_04475 [Limisphaerales bacterium]